MIGVKDKWQANFEMSFNPFIFTDNLISFMVVEEAGNVLPTFELEFKTDNDRVVGFVNEGNTINASMGVHTYDLVNMPLKPMKKKLARESGGEFRILVKGMLDKIEYLTDSDVKVTPKQSSFATILQETGKYFNVDADLSTSKDMQSWIQHGITSKQFVEDLWKHADLGTDNFPMIGIGADSSFRLRDLNTMKNGPYKFNFSIKDTGPNTYRYSSDYVIESDTGLMNYWQGYDKASSVINLDQGIGSLFSSIISNGFAITGILEKAASAGKRIGEILLQNANMHKNFHQSAINNMANLATFSNSRITFSVPDVYVPIKILDVFQFKDDIDTSKGATESYSGRWICSKIVRSISGYKFNTLIVGCRESMNSVQG